MNGDILSFLAKYAVNMNSKHFSVLTARRRTHKITDLEVIMLGDSHGWGQGAPGYNAAPPIKSAHMAFPYSKGFFAGLREHINQKYDFYPNTLNLCIGNQTANLHTINGIYKEIKVDVIESAAATGFYAPHPKDEQALLHLGYLATNHKFNERLLVIAPDEDGNAVSEIDMTAHASKVYIGVLAGSCGAKLEVYFRGTDQPIGDLQDAESEGKSNAAGYPYCQAEGYPKVTRIRNGEHIAATTAEAIVNGSTSVVINTFRAGGDEEVVYCIDYGQKQLGKLCFAYDGAHPEAEACELVACSVQTPVLRIRGIVFDSNAVRNFSMGGHTVGQWLGDGTSSYNDPSYPHMDEILRFVPFTPALTIIQAPIVNEYLRQTPIDTFTSNLSVLLDKLNSHHNKDGSRRMDVLLFTTPGDKSISFEGGVSAAIEYNDYYQAVRQFSAQHGYGFIDFEQYFRDCVASGLLDYEFLFDDPIHPSPYVNEFIRKVLAEVIDLIM